MNKVFILVSSVSFKLWMPSGQASKSRVESDNAQPVNKQRLPLTPKAPSKGHDLAIPSEFSRLYLAVKRGLGVFALTVLPASMASAEIIVADEGPLGNGNYTRTSHLINPAGYPVEVNNTGGNNGTFTLNFGVFITDDGSSAFVLGGNALLEGLTVNGTLEATATGFNAINLTDTSTINTLNNDGAIRANKDGNATIFAPGTIATLNNTGYIEHTGSSTALILDNATSVTNDGVIRSDTGHAVLFGFSGPASIGSFTNNGTISTNTSTAGKAAIELGDGGNIATVNSLVNTGRISSTLYDAISMTTPGSSMGLTNSGIISAARHGLLVSNGTELTSFDNNSGIITSSGAGDAAALYLREGQDAAITNAGYLTNTSSGYGLWLDTEAQTQDFTNSGTISSTAGTAIKADSAMTGSSNGFVNTGSIIGGGGTAINTESDFKLTNSGTITGDINHATTGALTIEQSAGSIDGNVASTADAAHSLTLNGGAVTGNISLNGSTANSLVLNGATVAGNINIGTGVINVNDDFTTGGTLSGTTVNVASTKTLDIGHSVTAAVANDGTLDLNTGASVNGAISGTGVVNVNDDFTTGSTITADTVNIAANKTMSLAHNITAKTTSNAGTTSIESGVNITISGDYSQSATGIFQTNVSNDATYGQLNVTGTVTLPSNAKINVNVADPNFNFTTALTNGMSDIISAGTLISDGTFVVTDNSLLFTFDAIKDADTVDLTLTSDTSEATVFSATSSQGKTAATGAATVLDEQISSDPSGQIASSFVGLTTKKDVAEAAESTLPGISGSVSQLTNISTNAVRDVISARQDSIRGLASGDDYFADKHAWFRPFGAWTEQDDRQGVTGYGINSYGLAIGIDGNVSTTWNTGFALAYIRSDVDSDLAAGSHTIGVDSYLANVYATKIFDDVTALNLQFGGGLSDYDSSRRLFTNDVADADYGSWQVQASAELERSYSLSDKTVLTPFVEADYNYVDVESYNETGAGALSLNVDSDSADSLIIGTGVKASHTASNSLLLVVNAGLGYDVMTDRSTLTASFAGGGAQFTTRGIEQDEWVYSTAVSATYSLDNGTEITARYDVDGREDYIEQSISTNVRWMF